MSIRQQIQLDTRFLNKNTKGSQKLYLNHQKPNKMKDLLSMALEATKENVVKSTRKESVNESLLRILHKDGRKLTRLELIAQISLDRLYAEYGEDEIKKIAQEDPEKFKKLMKGVNKTVKNGLDTSVSHSSNNSSFHYNDKYNHLELEEVNGKFQITPKKKVESKK